MRRKYFRLTLMIAATALIFVAVSCGAVFAAYPQFGWVYRVKPDAAPRSIVFAGENVIVLQSEKNLVHFIDAGNGGRIWAYSLDRPVDIFPLERGGVLAVGDSIIHRLDFVEKKRAWTQSLCDVKGRALYLSADGGRIYVNCGAGAGFVYDVQTGEVAKNAGALPDGAKQLGGLGLAEFNPSLLGGDRTLNIQGGGVSLYAGTVQSLVWSYQDEANFAPTAAMYGSKLLLLSSAGVLSALDPQTGREAWKVDLLKVIDMRFWDELPQRINNYSLARIFTHGDFLYVMPPSGLVQIKVLPFPPEIRLGKGAEVGAEDDTQKWALNKAIQAWDASDFRTALDGFREAATIWPNSPEVLMFTGMAYSALRDASPGYLDLAISTLEDAHKAAPLNPDISSNLIGNYLLKAFSMNPAVQRGEIVDIYRKMVEADQFAFVSHAGLADALLSQRDYAAASDALRKSFDFGFFGAEQYSLLVTSLYLQDDREEAARVAEESVRFFPASRPSYVLRAKIFSKEGSYKQAAKLFAEAPPADESARRPDISSYPRMMAAGSAFFEANAIGLSGDYSKALDKLHDFINGLPTEKEIVGIKKNMNSGSDAQNGRMSLTMDARFKGKSPVELVAEYEFKAPAMMTAAHFHYRLGDRKQSVELLNKAAKIADGDDDTMSFIGYYYALNGVFLGKAVQYTAQALRKSPNDSAFLRNYAVALWKNNRNDEAEKVFKKAIAQKAAVEFLYYDYGKFLLDNNREKEAVAMFKKELESGPELAEPAKALKYLSSKKPQK